MKILIAGGSGFVGRNLAKSLSQKYDITLLSRSDKEIGCGYKKYITWSNINEGVISEYDIVINLCGYNIGQSRWSKSTKEKIISSRIDPTQKLVSLIGDKDIWLINASAIGFYNFSEDTQDESCYISNLCKLGFSQEVVYKWESVITRSELQKYSILRFGVVIGNGGVLEKMTMTAKLGVLSKFSSGEQLMSWVSMHDLTRAFEFIIESNYSRKKVFNITSPHATSNADMVSSIKKITNSKIVLSMPKIIIKILFGQMGYELLLSSQNIHPKKLLESGFTFDDPNINDALHRYL